MSAEARETDQLRLRRVVESDPMAKLDDPPAFALWQLDEQGEEVKFISVFSEQEVSDLLADQRQEPQAIGLISRQKVSDLLADQPQEDILAIARKLEGEYCFAFRDRFFVCSEADPEAVVAASNALPRPQQPLVAESSLPPARTMLETWIHDAAEDGEESSFQQVLDVIPNLVGASDDPEAEGASIAALLSRTRDEGHLTEDQYIQCFDALNNGLWRLELSQLKPAPPRTGLRIPIPEATRHAVWRRDEGRCTSCGSAERLEFDHIIPLSRGGSNTERNLQLLCERCNRSKAAQI